MAGVREYRDADARAAGMGTLDAWYDHLEVGELLEMVRQEVAVKRLGKREARRAEQHGREGAYPRQRPRARQARGRRSTASCGSSPTRR